MKYYFLYLSVMLFLFGSCAWNSQTPQEDWKKEKDTEDREEVVPESLPEDKKEVEAELEAEVKVKEVPKVKVKKTSKQTIPPLVVEKNELPNKPQEFIYPEDYPSELKQWSEQGESLWNTFFNEKPEKNFSLIKDTYLEVHYLGMTVGQIGLFFKGLKKRPGTQHGYYHLQARLKSSPFYSALYKLDDMIDVFVDEKKFLPFESRLIQKDGDKKNEEKQYFSFHHLKQEGFFLQHKKEGLKKKEWEGWLTKYGLDGLSSLWFMRSLPLKVGYTFQLPVANKGKMLLVNGRVLALERIKTAKGQKNAFKISAETQYTGRVLKSGHIFLWLDEAPGHELLRAQAKIQIGSVHLEIISNDS